MCVLKTGEERPFGRITPFVAGHDRPKAALDFKV